MTSRTLGASLAVLTFLAGPVLAQVPKPADTEVWQPVPAVVTPGRQDTDPAF